MTGSGTPAAKHDVARLAEVMQHYARARGQLFDWRGMAAAVLESLGKKVVESGLRPEGLRPEGLRPEGLRPEGLRPEGRPKPLFVVVEGVDRCGKSTLAEILAERMRVCGRTTYVFGIPDYSTSLGQLISQQLAGGEMLVGAGGERSRDDLLSLECLMICARYVTSHQIWQALTAGYSVVCVRWWQSALLYGTDDGLDPSLIEAACSALPEPDLNLLVQVEVKEIVHRLDPGNLYESDRPKQCRLAESYRELWSRWSGSVEGLKWVVVDGSGTIPEVADRAWKAVGRVRSDLK